MQNPVRWIYSDRYRNHYRFSNWNRNLPRYINRKLVVVPDMKFFRKCVIEGEQKQTDINKPRFGISKWNERYEAYIESEAKRLKVSVKKVITHELFKHPTLSFADIPHDKLHPLNLSWINLAGVRFKDREINDVNFTGANLDYVEFPYWEVTNVNFSGASLFWANFEEASLRNVKFLRTNLIGTRFHHAQLNYCNFSESNLNSIDFSYARLNSVDFLNSLLGNCQFKYASLTRSDFTSSDILTLNTEQIDYINDKYYYHVNDASHEEFREDVLNYICSKPDYDPSSNNSFSMSFLYAKLTDVQYNKTNLFRCSFIKAKIENVSFTESRIIKCSFVGSDLRHADFSFSNILSTDYSQSSQTNTDYHWSNLLNCLFNLSYLTNVQIYGAYLFRFTSLDGLKADVKRYDISKGPNDGSKELLDMLYSFISKWRKYISPYDSPDIDEETSMKEPIGFWSSYLTNVNYTTSTLLEYNLSLCSMRNCLFKGADLCHCDFDKINTDSLQLHQVMICDVNFSEAKLPAANFSDSKGINGCRFDGADLTNADFSHSEGINGCSFNKADLTNASFAESKVSDCEFINTILSHTVLPDNYDWNMFCKGHRFTIPAHSFNVELIALSVILTGLTIPMTLTALFDIFPTGTYLLHTVRCGFEIIPPSSLLTGMIACTLLIIAIALLVYPVLFIIQYERYRLGMNDQDFLSWINRCYWITGCCILILSTLWIIHFMAGAMCETLCMFTLSLTVLGIILAHRIPERIYFSIYEKSVFSGLQEKKKD